MSDETLKQKERRTRGLALQRLAEMGFKTIPIKSHLFHIEAHDGPLVVWIHVSSDNLSPEIIKIIKREQVPDGIRKRALIRDYHKKSGFKTINF